MNPIIEINERVTVGVKYFSDVSERLKCIPEYMNFHGRKIKFEVFGMRHQTEKGKRMVHVFEMSDKANDYRLELDAERLTWTLVSILEGRYVR